MTRVAALQLEPVLGDLAGNAERILRAVEEALAAGVDVIVLPELATSGYVFTSLDEARALATTPSDPLFATCAALLATRPGAVLVLGFPERVGDVLHNAAALITEDGVQGVYRKVHLWDREKLWFTPGSAPPLVVDTAHGRIGVLICFDLEFPEWTRIASLAGADLLAVPVNWPDVRRTADERLDEQRIAVATSLMNRVAIAVADRTGVERGVGWCEGTCIVDARGRLRATAGDGLGSASADLDLLQSRDKRQTDLVDTFSDRRPDLYGSILAARG
ncbi:nitrilase-related carbon-nitrogen hydrolase [Amnibacterium kyonggiense]